MAESNFVDYVKIFCRSGKGGRGSAHLRHDKYIPTYGSVNGTNKNIITIGGANSRTSDNTTPLFQYGRGRGLKVIAGSVTNKNEIVTRIYPFGSERNIRPAYYRGKDIKDAPGVDIPNLMLPIDHWGTTLVEGEPLPDPKKAYIDNASGIAKYGIRPKKVYFDGTGDEKEIYPTIQEVTIGEVRSNNPPISPSSTLWPNTSQRVDEVIAVTNPTDNGYQGDGVAKYDYYTSTAASQSSMTVKFNATDASYEASKTLYSTIYDGTAPSNSDWYVEMYDGGTLSFNCVAQECVVRVRMLLQGQSASDFRHEDVEFSSHGIYTYGTGMNKYLHSCTIKDILSSYGHAEEVTVYLERIDPKNLNAYYNENITVTFSGSGSFGWYTKMQNSFTIRIPQVGFDINGQAALGSGITVAMKDGTCAGREFPVTKCQYISNLDAWELTLTRVEDSSTSYLYPNANGYEIAIGDHFVFLDIEMPELYINIAASRLETEATKRLGELATETMQYTPEIDSKVIVENGWTLREGMWMAVYDPDLSLSPNGGESDLFSSDPSDLFSDNNEDLHADDSTTYVLIDSITIDEGAASIPIYKVTLSDKKRDSLVSYISKNLKTAKQASALLKNDVAIIKKNLLEAN